MIAGDGRYSIPRMAALRVGSCSCRVLVVLDLDPSNAWAYDGSDGWGPIDRSLFVVGGRSVDRWMYEEGVLMKRTFCPDHAGDQADRRMTALVYTQQSVAFPWIDTEDSQTDTLNVSLAVEGGGTLGEMNWSFSTFSNRQSGVKLAVYGDGLPCLYDERVQKVMEAWRNMPDPDEITVTEFISLLEECGAVPSRYQREALSKGGAN